MGARVPDVPAPSDADIHREKPSGRLPIEAKLILDIYFGRRELDSIKRVFDATAELRERIGKARLRPPELTKGELRVTWQYPPRILNDGTRARDTDLISDPKFGFVWLSGARYSWKGWKERRLENTNDLNEVGMLRFFAQNRDKRWGVDEDESEDHADDGTPIFANADASSNRDVTVVEALRRLGEFAHGQGAQRHDDRQQWEALLQKRFNMICSPKEYKGYWIDHARYGPTPLLEENGREYPFDTAASGELVVLHYLTQFTFPRPVNNSLILIDEPELHLHPKWVRQLYDALPAIGENNQFIMTTHSPDLRQLAAEDNALIDMGSLYEQSPTHA